MRHHHYWKSPSGYEGVSSSQPSCTEPGQGFTPAETVRRLLAGGSPPTSNQPIYLGDENFVDPMAMFDVKIEDMQLQAREAQKRIDAYKAYVESLKIPPEPKAPPAPPEK